MIHSMTGFGAAAGTTALSTGAVNWRWEIKGVNGKGLDVKLRVPTALDTVEQEVRARATAAVSRGTLHISLQTDREESAARPVIDEAALEAVIVAAKLVEKKSGGAPVTVDALLNARGVLVTADPTPGEEEQAKLDADLVAGFEIALREFTAARGTEGAQLSHVLTVQLEEMTALIARAKELATQILPRHFTQISEKIRELIGNAMPEDRAEQEAALLAVKSDIREELDRFDGHLEAASNLIKEGGVVGRKLDFLAQEFGREANTLTSKAPDLDMKRLGIDLKLVVDRFREQVQNIE